MEKRNKIMAVSLACAALVAGAIAINASGASIPTVDANVTTPADQTLTFSASDFTAVAGDLIKNGNTFHYGAVSLNGSTVQIGSTGIIYNIGYAGSSDVNGVKGSGFKTISFTGLSSTASSGYIHTFDQNAGNGHLYSLSGKTAAYTIDLTKDESGTVDVEAKNRVRFQLEMGAEDGKYVSFTTMTVTYGCRTLTPSVALSSSASYVQMDKTLAVTATPSEIGSSTPTYAWSSSNTSIFTIAGSGATATVTPVAVGTANVQVVMTVDAADYSSSLAIEVKSAGLLGTAIGSLAELEAAFDGAGTNTGKSYYLNSDIDCSAWNVLNNGMAGEYSGTFDGNGHSLTNLAIKNGLFNIIASSGVVKNLTLSGTFAPAGDGFGFIAFQNNGSAKNVNVSVYPTETHAGALSATFFNGSGTMSDMTVTAYFALDVKEGAFFADTCQATITPSGTNVGTYYNKAATATDKTSSLIQAKTGFTITNSGTW